jgi:hypothetical protein
MITHDARRSLSRGNNPVPSPWQATPEPARQTRVITGQEYPTNFLQDYWDPSKSADQGAGQQTGGTGQGIYGREPTPELRL